MSPIDVDLHAEWRLQELRRSYQRPSRTVVRPALGTLFVKVGDRLLAGDHRVTRSVLNV